MTDETIPPALAADEWAKRLAPDPDAETPQEIADARRDVLIQAAVYALEGGAPRDGTDAHRAMALANAALPDGDRRKLTWGMAHSLRALREHFGPSRRDALDEAADAIAALLPPETP